MKTINSRNIAAIAAEASSDSRSKQQQRLWECGRIVHAAAQIAKNPFQRVRGFVQSAEWRR
jgi:hypothetical protein